MKRWLFRVRGFAGHDHPYISHGRLLVDTVHDSESSASAEIDAWKVRMRRGQAERVELIDLRSDGALTNLTVTVDTDIPWSWTTIERQRSAL